MFLTYINDNKIHGIHDIVNQVQSVHYFVYGVIGGLSLANHNRTLTHRMLFKPSIKLINDERDPLVHQSIQVRFGTRHFYHHANLKNKKTFQCPGHKKRIPLQKLTHRQPVIVYTMAMVAAIGPGGT